MPTPAAIPGAAWIITAIAAGFAIIILIIYLGEAIRWLSLGVLITGAPLGLVALYRIYKEIFSEIKKDE